MPNNGCNLNNFTKSKETNEHKVIRQKHNSEYSNYHEHYRHHYQHFHHHRYYNYASSKLTTPKAVRSTSTSTPTGSISNQSTHTRSRWPTQSLPSLSEATTTSWSSSTSPQSQSQSQKKPPQMQHQRQHQQQKEQRRHTISSYIHQCQKEPKRFLNFTMLQLSNAVMNCPPYHIATDYQAPKTTITELRMKSKIHRSFNTLQYSEQQQYYSKCDNNFLNESSGCSGGGDNSCSCNGATLKTPNLLKNTQKRYRRKLFALNFMLKNLITYRFKYNLL